MITTTIKLAAAVTCMGLACPGIANSQPWSSEPDFPDIDETFALNYAVDHDREVCRILDRRLTQADPSFNQIYSAINDVAALGDFNYETAGYVIGAAMSKSCPQHVEQFEAAFGEEIA